MMAERVFVIFAGGNGWKQQITEIAANQDRRHSCPTTQHIVCACLPKWRSPPKERMN